MKVKDLIEELKKLDPDATVWANSKNEGGYQMYIVTEINRVDISDMNLGAICLD